MFVLFNFIVGMLIGFLSGFVARITDHQEIGLAGSLLYSLATLVPGLAVTVRATSESSIASEEALPEQSRHKAAMWEVKK